MKRGDKIQCLSSKINLFKTQKMHHTFLTENIKNSPNSYFKEFPFLVRRECRLTLTLTLYCVVTTQLGLELDV